MNAQDIRKSTTISALYVLIQLLLLKQNRIFGLVGCLVYSISKKKKKSGDNISDQGHTDQAGLIFIEINPPASASHLLGSTMPSLAALNPEN